MSTQKISNYMSPEQDNQIENIVDIGRGRQNARISHMHEK